MIQVIPAEADNVLAFSAIGKVSGADYEQVLMPAVEAALQENEKVRLLYHFGPDFEGYDADAMWDDAKIGMKHYTSFEKIAVVTDVKWMVRSVKAFGFLMPGEVRVFDNDEFDAAMIWIAE
jgi:hypothetical protein